MHFGVDYYPEHWVYPYAGTAEDPESRWAEDVKLMSAAGINVVRMGEFSWGICERQECQYDFEWLRRAMDIMGNAGIKVVLGTPTAAPPLWLAAEACGCVIYRLFTIIIMRGGLGSTINGA